MIPNQSQITLDGIRQMLIIRHASNDDYKMSTINILDDDILNFLDPEINHGLIEELILDDWVHVDPLLPNPELDKVLWDLVQLVSKYDR